MKTFCGVEVALVAMLVAAWRRYKREHNAD